MPSPDRWVRTGRWLGQAYLGFIVVLGMAVVLLAIGAALGRWVIHGPVSGPALERAVAREAGATDAYRGQAARCRPGSRPGVWICDVTHDESAGSVPYAVTLRRGSSCWDARRTRPPVARSPARASGCVYLWQWRLL